LQEERPPLASKKKEHLGFRGLLDHKNQPRRTRKGGTPGDDQVDALIVKKRAEVLTEMSKESGAGTRQLKGCIDTPGIQVTPAEPAERINSCQVPLRSRNPRGVGSNPRIRPQTGEVRERSKKKLIHLLLWTTEGHLCGETSLRVDSKKKGKVENIMPMARRFGKKTFGVKNYCSSLEDGCQEAGDRVR